VLKDMSASNQDLQKMIHDLQNQVAASTQQLTQNDQQLANYLTQQFNILYREMESLFSLNSVINFRYPLPPMRGWAISPDFGTALVSQILKDKPKTILELGSGVSTILCGYILEKLGAGKVISFDHEEKFAQKTVEQIGLHGLDAFCEVYYAPLKEWELPKGKWQWYDLSLIKDISDIDMVIVDGPPESLQKHSRYPALPLLQEKFSEKITILVDDAGREDEQVIVQHWMDEYKVLSLETIESEKGITILKKN
jgi:predicted O-methyltransferase YrrM